MCSRSVRGWRPNTCRPRRRATTDPSSSRKATDRRAPSGSKARNTKAHWASSPRAAAASQCIDAGGESRKAKAAIAQVSTGAQPVMPTAAASR